VDVPYLDGSASGGSDASKDKCPCCGADPHAHSAGAKKISKDEFYNPPAAKLTKKEAAVVGDAGALMSLARNDGQPPGKCKDILPPDPPSGDPCEQHYVVKSGKPARDQFDALGGPYDPSHPDSPTDAAWLQARERVKAMRDAGAKQIAHKTPLCAGGCPFGKNNLSPVSDPDCLWLEKELGTLQQKLAKIQQRLNGIS
jgi:hypothetical protein